MHTSTEIKSIANHVGYEKAIELVAKAGFNAWDFTLTEMVEVDWPTRTGKLSDNPLGKSDFLKVARRYRRIGEDNGIYCNQSHAPFPVDVKAVRDNLKRSLECTAEAGGKICIIHPDNNKSAEENAEMYFELLPFAKSVGVKIATENMWNWKGDQAFDAACSNHLDFRKHLDVINDPYFVACLDIGHAEMRGLNTDQVLMIHTLSEKLCALHIHDNDKHRDLHQLPFEGSIDFHAMVKALKEIDYKGEFTLEVDSYLKKFTAENVFVGVKNMFLAARKLADEFENL